MEDKIKDENLLRSIKLKLCTTPIKSYKEIEEINITNKNFLGNILNIDLKEITKLKSLEVISLKFFEINDEVIDSLNMLEKLNKIEFYMCDFKTNKKINNNIKHITIYCCNNFNRNILKDTINIESLEITKSGLVDFNELQIYKKLSILIVRDCSLISLPKISELENLEYLYINNIEIQCTFDISGMKKLKFISFNGSKLPNKELYIKQLQEQNPNVEVECRKEDLPIG